MPERIKQLRHDIQDFLDEEIRCKNPEDRSSRENLLLEMGQNFLDLLNRQHHTMQSDRERISDAEMTKLLQSYRGLGELTNGAGK